MNCGAQQFSQVVHVESKDEPLNHVDKRYRAI